MKKKIFVFIFLLLVIIGVSSSYAYLKAEKGSSNNNSLTVNTLDVILLTDINNINLNNEEPKEDSEGLSNPSTTFSIKNNAGMVASYKVSLVDGTTKSTVINKDVKYRLKRTNATTNETVTMDIKNLDGTGLIDTGIIEANQVYNYELVMWLDINSNPNGLVFSKNILVEGMQVASLDESGANYPELTDNMIPVYYDKTSDTEGVWRVADKKNLNETYKWFDYNDFMWANAVTVNKDVMDNYYGYSGADTSKEMNVNIETNEEVSETKAVTTYTSGNKGVDSSTSTATFKFTTSSAGVLTFDYSVSSETNYDKLTIKINNGSTDTTLVNAISGTLNGSKEYNLVANTSYTLTASYTKDSSSANGSDQATISNITITSTLSSDLAYTADATYPYTSETKDVTFVTPAKKQMAASSYTYDETTGIYTLTNPQSIAYTSSNVGYYTCNSSVKTTCVKMYEIKALNNQNVVTTVNVHKGANKGDFASVLGQEVKMEDITTMWVWIPRYKYVIFNGNNGLSEEQEIKIQFEHGIDKTGTVSCTENILTANDSSSSETCTDTTNGTIVNNKSTYTHPAFTFGDEELTGIWYAKFEMSTDQTSECVTSQSTTNCDKVHDNIYVKPDQISLRYQKIANEFQSIRNMELFNNIHGFNQNETATTSSQTGEITNDNNNIDIHMQKNMEWGAATYLAYSKYGKYGNSLYTGIYKRVYKNNWYQNASGLYIYKTGYSGYSYNASSSTTNTTSYNDLTDLGSGKGYKGAGASTTGTVYGIYDMNGGAWDYTMGNEVNTSGAFYSSSAGFTTNPLSKYYDKYSYNTSNYSKESISRGHLGDATREMTKKYINGTGGSWEDSFRHFPYSNYSWFGYGGDSLSTYGYGITLSYYANGNGYNTNSSRPVLVVSRNFPWLEK